MCRRRHVSNGLPGAHCYGGARNPPACRGNEPRRAQCVGVRRETLGGGQPDGVVWAYRGGGRGRRAAGGCGLGGGGWVWGGGGGGGARRAAGGCEQACARDARS